MLSMICTFSLALTLARMAQTKDYWPGEDIGETVTSRQTRARSITFTRIDEGFPAFIHERVSVGIETIEIHEEHHEDTQKVIARMTNGCWGSPTAAAC